MKKIDRVVLKETAYIFAFSAILSVFMQAVFLILAKWDCAVLLGGILGLVTATGNFLLMGITVQNAVLKDEKDARSLMKLSQSLRMLMLFIVALIAYLLPFVNIIAVVVTYLFPRIAVMLRAAFVKK